MRCEHGEMQQKRRDMQIIFQDPLASLNPRMTVGEIIAEPLTTFKPDLTGAQAKDRVRQMMAKVGLLPNMINRYPHEFSGGQAQRIGIARAMINSPKLIVCDEPVSALDVSIQAQIVNLLMDLQARDGLSLIFISHNLSVVRHISHRDPGALSRQGDGDRGPRFDLRQPAASLYAGADLGGADSRSRPGASRRTASC